MIIHLHYMTAAVDEDWWGRLRNIRRQEEGTPHGGSTGLLDGGRRSVGCLVEDVVISRCMIRRIRRESGGELERSRRQGLTLNKCIVVVITGWYQQLSERITTEHHSMILWIITYTPSVRILWAIPAPFSCPSINSFPGKWVLTGSKKARAYGIRTDAT